MRFNMLNPGGTEEVISDFSKEFGGDTDEICQAMQRDIVTMLGSLSAACKGMQRDISEMKQCQRLVTVEEWADLIVSIASIECSLTMEIDTLSRDVGPEC